jgi:histidine triad (HIT) family protein
MTDENCIFCKIAHKEIPSDKIYEDENVFAFLDIHPVNKGHALVIPKKHAVNIYDIEDEEISKVIKTAQKIAKQLKVVVKADGINIHMNNEKAGGQAVFHAHIHVIPRHENDGLTHWESCGGYKEGESKEIAKILEDLLSK